MVSHYVFPDHATKSPDIFATMFVHSTLIDLMNIPPLPLLIITPGGGECDVLCIDERKVMIRSRNMYSQPNPNAEGVSSDLEKRPKTSMHH